MDITISLTDISNGERIVLIWQNITHFTRGASTGTTWVYLTSGKRERVKESVLQIEQMIERAASE